MNSSTASLKAEAHGRVLVTGAGRGIGRAAALEFAKNGYDVAVNCAHDEEALKSLHAQIKELGRRCVMCMGDVGSAGDADRVMSAAQEGLGGIDILVNNAGISYIGLLQDMTPEEWNAVISTNLTAAYNTCRRAIPIMLKNGDGRIINVSSVWGNIGASCEVAYSASKGGLNAFTRALAKELAPSNIRVNAVACGAIDTSMNSFLEADEMQALIDEIPAGRLGRPEEAAAMIRLIAQAPEYLTGQIITLDGGWQI